jgi:hypothetical protein
MIGRFFTRLRDQSIIVEVPPEDVSPVAQALPPPVVDMEEVRTQIIKDVQNCITKIAVKSGSKELMLEVALAVWDGENSDEKLHSLLDLMKEHGGKERIVELLLSKFTDYVMISPMRGYNVSIEPYSFGKHDTKHLGRMGDFKREIFRWVKKNMADFEDSSHVAIFDIKYGEGGTEANMKRLDGLAVCECAAELLAIRKTSSSRTLRHYAMQILERAIDETDDDEVLGTIGRWGLDKAARMKAVQKLFEKGNKGKLTLIESGDNDRPQYNDPEVRAEAKRLLAILAAKPKAE